MTKSVSAPISKVKLKQIPEYLRQTLIDEARKAGRTLNQEIVLRIEQELDRVSGMGLKP